MIIHRNLNTLFDQIAAGVPITYILQLQVVASGAAAAHEHAIRVQLKDLILSAEGDVRWEMPNADATCALFYTTGTTIDVTGMVDTTANLERRIKDENPAFGEGWQLRYLLTAPLPRP